MARTGSLLAFGALVLTSAAFAQEAALPVIPVEPLEWDKNFSVSSDPNPLGQTSFQFEETSRTFSWGGDDDRWQMNFDMVTRSEDSPLPREEMSAVASYSFTPRFSLGGTVTLGAQELDDMSAWEEQRIEAGVKLKSSFKF